MNAFALGLCLLLPIPVSALAQVVPTTPKKFTTRPVGESSSTTGASITPRSTAPEIRQVAYLTLSPERAWNSVDGKSRTGKLIAYEESVTVSKGGAAPVAPVPPATKNPTVVKEGKARLLIDRKAYEVPLDRLGTEERTFIQELQASLAAKP